jgi:signal transduction histidine kinase
LAPTPPAAERTPASSAAVEAERRRWARELHDDALGALDGLQSLLREALRAQDAQTARAATREALAVVEQELVNLRSIAAELESTGGACAAAHDDLHRGVDRR